MLAWHETEPMLYGWLLKQTQSHHETEDIMQDVFIKAMQNSERFCTLDDSKAWLFKMTKNRFIDLVRRKVASDELADIDAPREVAPVMTQLQSCLPRLLPKLKDEERHIIEQCDLNGMTQKQFSEQNLLSLPATKARLRRARLVLKQHLEQECQVERDRSGVCCFKRMESDS
ncbi:RNA polymerase sigma factor [Vibrio agarilyticus]|nr:sigma-70 family RNA polymerase sigma factor [Vibrio agarilyticus]